MPAKQQKRPAQRKKARLPRITSSMKVMEIAALHPGTVDVLAAYGLHCVGCSMSELDTLDEGARLHGLDDLDIENIVTDLNEVLLSAPVRPATLTITLPAAKALLAIAKKEGKEGQLLEVISENGSFCMEFRKTAPDGAKIFRNPGAPEMTIVAAEATLTSIGGSTIDYREGRFKLDMASPGCACGKGACSCASHAHATSRSE